MGTDKPDKSPTEGHKLIEEGLTVGPSTFLWVAFNLSYAHVARPLRRLPAYLYILTACIKRVVSIRGLVRWNR